MVILQEKCKWKKARNKKQNVFCLPSSVFHKKFLISILISILTAVIELGPPVSESSTRISKFYDPTDTGNRKLAIHRVWTGVPMNGEPKVITTTSSSTYNKDSLKLLYTHPQGLRITLKTFHFPETMQVLSNPTPITQSSINPQCPIGQKPTIIGLIIHKHSTPH